MATFLDDVDLMKVDGTTHKGKEALKGKKVIGLYFSAHWCPPCRQFTPVLKEFYEELESDEIEIIFVSSDHSADALKEYMQNSHGDWYYIPFGSEELDKLKMKYDITGIPTLVIVDPSGKVITKEGRADVSGKAPKQALSSWLKSA